MKTVEETLLKLSQHHGPTLVDEWEAMDDTAEQIDGEWSSPYISKVSWLLKNS